MLSLLIKDWSVIKQLYALCIQSIRFSKVIIIKDSEYQIVQIKRSIRSEVCSSIKRTNSKYRRKREINQRAATNKSKIDDRERAMLDKKINISKIEASCGDGNINDKTNQNNSFPAGITD